MLDEKELIGIISGISKDGSITNKEAASLRSWVAKNRNYVFEKKHDDLLEKIESVAADGIIYDAEREELVRLVESMMTWDCKDITCLNYLASFFDGVECNQHLDTTSLERLENWMQEYDAVITTKSYGERLLKSLESVLNTGIVTVAKQNEILSITTEAQKIAKLESKIGQLWQLVREHKNIGIELIEILDNADAIEEIHARAESWLKKGLYSYSGTVTHTEIIFVSLVLIAMLHYDGNYYYYVKSTYEKLYDDIFLTEQKIEGKIRTILKKYNNTGNDINEGARIINVALSDAIVPVHYLPAFFEFIYDIYKLNFDWDLPENLYDEFCFVYEGIQNAMASDGDDLSLSVTQKSYKLIRSTKRLIINDQMDALVKLSVLVSELIDKKVWDKEVTISNPYLKAGYEGWVKTLKEDVKTGRNAHNVGELRSKWEPEFRLVNNLIYLVPPVHKVKAHYNPYEIYVLITCGDKIVEEDKRPYVSEIIGGYKVSTKKFQITSPLTNLRYRLMAGNDCIYDSKDKLYRECLVFTPDGKEIENNTNYEGGAVLCHKAEDERFKSFYHTSGYYLSFLKVTQGMTVVVGETRLNFSKFAKPGIFGFAVENAYIKKLDETLYIPLYKDISCVFFESDSKTANYEILINGKSYKASSFEIQRSETERGSKNTVYLNISDSGIYDIRVFQIETGKKQKLLSNVVAVDAKLSWSTEHIEDAKYNISVDSDLIGNPLFEERDVSDYDEEFISFRLDGDTYNLILPFRFSMYRLSGQKWVSFSKDIWIGDINSNSYVEFAGTNICKAELRCSNGVCIEEDIPVRRLKNTERIDVGFLLAHKAEFDYVILVISQENQGPKAIYCYNKCVFDSNKTEAFYSSEEGLLTVIPRYYGRGNIYYTIEDKNAEIVYKSSHVESGVPDYALNVTLFAHYTINFWAKEKGLSLKKETLLASLDKVFYSIDAFVGRSFKIYEVFFDQYSNGQFIRKNWMMKNAFVYFKSKKGNGLFEGEVYSRTSRGVYMLNRVNPVEIEVCGDIVNETLELSITKDGDGLFLDFEHSGLKNTLDDPKAVDIFSYIINVNGVETV